MGASGRQSMLRSRSSVLTSSVKSSEEREESGEPGESAILKLYRVNAMREVVYGGL